MKKFAAYRGTKKQKIMLHIVEVFFTAESYRLYELEGKRQKSYLDLANTWVGEW
jgi:hypothetical protein